MESALNLYPSKIKALDAARKSYRGFIRERREFQIDDINLDDRPQFVLFQTHNGYWGFRGPYTDATRETVKQRVIRHCSTFGVRIVAFRYIKFVDSGHR